MADRAMTTDVADLSLVVQLEPTMELTELVPAPPAWSYHWFVIGTFLTKRQVNFTKMCRIFLFVW
ncbi:hypothetical protein LINGRAHAP2_LOCUS2059 [Linum grandiflorum]